MGVRSRDNQNFSDRSGAYAPGSVDYHILLGMGLRSRARSSANNPYVRHHKVCPSPNPHLKAILSTLSAYHLYGKARNSGENSNETVHPGGKFSRKKGTPFEVLPFSNSYREFSDRRRRPKFSVPFVWITSARPRVERK